MSARRWLPVLLASALAACSSAERGEPRVPPAEVDETPPPERAEPEGFGTDEAGFDVTAYQALLTEYVTDDGGFRYAALHADAEDRAALAAVVRSVGDAVPAGWTRDAQLAFYINAYNLMTINLVIDRWPLTSVMESEGFFREATHRIASEDITLDHLENQIVRAPRFSEPRIHFAINCASAGCPWLSRTAYTAQNLEAQLASQARSFVRRQTRLDRDARRVEISEIFDWFADDFESVGGVRGFVSSQLEVEDAAFVRNADTEISHSPYDWAVNARD